MTIQGALSDLNNLLEADDIPVYYKTSIKKIIETIEQEGVNKDTDFVPVEIELLGKKGSGYLYKPQQIIVTGYFTLEGFKFFGGKYKEKEGNADE